MATWPNAVVTVGFAPKLCAECNGRRNQGSNGNYFRGRFVRRHLGQISSHELFLDDPRNPRLAPWQKSHSTFFVAPWLDPYAFFAPESAARNTVFTHEDPCYDKFMRKLCLSTPIFGVGANLGWGLTLDSWGTSEQQDKRDTAKWGVSIC